jgi:hypothetical protein
MTDTKVVEANTQVFKAPSLDGSKIPIGTRIAKRFVNPETQLLQYYTGSVVYYDQEMGWYGVSFACLV